MHLGREGFGVDGSTTELTSLHFFPIKAIKTSCQNILDYCKPWGNAGLSPSEILKA
jgi:hypothetical protein